MEEITIGFPAGIVTQSFSLISFLTSTIPPDAAASFTASCNVGAPASSEIADPTESEIDFSVYVIIAFPENPAFEISTASELFRIVTVSNVSILEKASLLILSSPLPRIRCSMDVYSNA